MSLDQIYYFIEIVKSGSMSQAAKQLHVSQPNISMTIKSLEKEIGYRLFNRVPRGVDLTKEGAQFLHYAESILSNIQGIKNIQEPHQDVALNFTISAQYSSSYIYPIIEMLHLFEHQKKTFTLRQSPFFDVVEDVENRRSNIGLLSIPTDQQNFLQLLLAKKSLAFTPITHYQMAIGIPKGHPLYEAPTLCICELTQYPLVLVEHSDKDYIAAHLMKQLQIDSFRSKVFVQDIFHFYHILSSIDGITFLPVNAHHDITLMLKHYNMKLKLFPLEESVDLEFGYIKPKDAVLNYSERYFINHLSTIFGHPDTLYKKHLPPHK